MATLGISACLGVFACSETAAPLDGRGALQERQLLLRAARVGLAPEAETVQHLVLAGAAEAGPLRLAGETRLGHSLDLPHASRLCLEGPGDPGGPPSREMLARASLGMALGAESGALSIRAHSGKTSLFDGRVDAGWRDLRLTGAALESGCVDLWVEAVDESPAGLAFAQPRLQLKGRTRPWVVLYVVDTFRFDQLGARIGSVAVAPAFDRFTGQSLSFQRAMGTSSWTRPTVATLLTGLAPSQHRVYGFADRLAPDLRRLPALLRDHGYHTVGLSSNPNIVPDWGFFGGFDRFVDLDVRVGPAREQGFERLIAAAISTVREESSAPLFLYVHDNGPHVPYQASAANRLLFGAAPAGSTAELPESVEDADTLREGRLLYAAAIRDTSDRFGALVAALEEVDRYEEAIVVLVGDHGEEFGEHGGLRHGETLYQEQIHVPLVIRAPGAGDGRVTRAVSTAGVAPTILSLLGITTPPEMTDSPSLLADPGGSRGDLLVSELDLLDYQAEAAILWPWKYLASGAGGERLFDLERDPGESQNLIEAHPEIAAALRSELSSRRRDANTGLGFSCVAGKRKRSLTVRLATDSGDFGPVERHGLEAADQLRAEGQQVVIEFELRPADRKVGLLPASLARARSDRDGFRAPEFSGGALKIEVEADGTASGGSGAEEEVRFVNAAGEPLAPELGAISLERLVTPLPPRGPSGQAGAVCQLYLVRGEETRGGDETIDPILEERLRELGYVR